MWIFPALLAAVVSNIELLAAVFVAVAVVGGLWLVLAPRRREQGHRVSLEEEVEEVVDDLKHPLSRDEGRA